MYDHRHIYNRVPAPLCSTPDIYIFRVSSFSIPLFHSVAPVAQTTNDEYHHYSRIMGLRPYFVLATDSLTYIHDFGPVYVG